MLINGTPIKGRVILAHGAGAGMESEFMAEIALALAAIGLQVIRFEFPYMVKSRIEGKRRPPDRAPKLLESFQKVIDRYSSEPEPLYIAGKSMGGRVATMLLASNDKVDAVFVFGYPFHPRGKADKLRTEHLMALSKPVLIFQGERDPMGSILEVKGYNLPSSIQLYWLADGDHDLKPRKSSGVTQAEHLKTVARIIKGYIQ